MDRIPAPLASAIYYDLLLSGGPAKAGLTMLATSSWLTIRFICEDSISSQSTHLCGTRFVFSMGLSVLSHLKVASAEVSAWHIAAERNQSMQWSPRLSAAANFHKTICTHQYEPQDAADHEPSCLGDSSLCNSIGAAFSELCYHFAAMGSRQVSLTTQ